MTYPDRGLPALAAGCRMTVCIPARNEAELIASTLDALDDQRGFDGAPLPRDLFDVVVFANSCTDATARVARRAAERTSRRIFVIERRLAFDRAHVGSARKYVLDLAAARFLIAGRPEGIVVSLDADTLPAPDWLAWIAREMNGRDAGAGRVTIAAADQERLLAPVRLLYARELAYRHILAEVQSLIDPRPEDPLPRHGSFVGASFAVSAGCYFAAGGLPARRRLEDLEFSRALRRIDARIRYSPDVRAVTSARPDARVEGGFGAFMADLHECARRGVSHTVEHPRETLAEGEVRAALRRLHRGAEAPGDIERIAELLKLPPSIWLRLVDSTAPLGAVYERVVQAAEWTRPRYAPARIETAIETLREAAGALRLAASLAVQTATFGPLDSLGAS